MKEKEEAKREYRKAISERHGAYMYLVDEEAPVSMSALRRSNSDDL